MHVFVVQKLLAPHVALPQEQARALIALESVFEHAAMLASRHQSSVPVFAEAMRHRCPLKQVLAPHRRPSVVLHVEAAFPSPSPSPQVPTQRSDAAVHKEYGEHLEVPHVHASVFTAPATVFPQAAMAAAMHQSAVPSTLAAKRHRLVSAQVLAPH